MDQQTLRVYEKRAEAIFARHLTVNRDRHHARLLAWLHPGEATADIGSGSGTDLAWLVSQGFPAVGYEPTRALRQLATKSFPNIDVRESSLPELSNVPDAAFANVVCSAVLMHLPPDSITPAIASLGRILRPGGRLALSYRTTDSETNREADGRLFTPIPPDVLETALSDAELRILDREAGEDQTRPGITWTSIVAEKIGAPDPGR